MVRKALQYAVKNGLVDGNVADQVDRPKKGKYLAGFYTREELAALFEATKDDSISVVIQLAAYYGLRRSEVLGIRWSAIDDEKGTLSINHKVTEGMVDGRHQIYTEDKLKTKSSFRTLPLIPAVRALLDEQRARQEEYRRLFKKSYCTEYLDYVCTDEMGRLFRPNYITDHFKLLLKQHGLRHIRFHDLRHSCASLLLSQGIPMKQIQEWLGHSTFATTADIYSHLDFNSKLESAQAISRRFRSGAGVGPRPVRWVAWATDLFGSHTRPPSPWASSTVSATSASGRPAGCWSRGLSPAWIPEKRLGASPFSWRM